MIEAITYSAAATAHTDIPSRLFKSSYDYDEDGWIAPEEAEISVLPVQPPKGWWEKLEYHFNPIKFVIQIKSPDRIVRKILRESEDCLQLLSDLKKDREYCVTRRKEDREDERLNDKLKTSGISLDFWALGLENVVNEYPPEAFKDLDKPLKLYYHCEEDECWLIVPEVVSILHTNGMIPRCLVLDDQTCITKVGPFLSKRHLAEWLIDF